MIFESRDMLRLILLRLDEGSLVSCMKTCKLAYNVGKSTQFIHLDFHHYPRYCVNVKVKHLKIWNFQLDFISLETGESITHLELWVCTQLTDMFKTFIFNNLQKLTIICHSTLPGIFVWDEFCKYHSCPPTVVLHLTDCLSSPLKDHPDWRVKWQKSHHYWNYDPLAFSSKDLGLKALIVIVECTVRPMYLFLLKCF